MESTRVLCDDIQRTTQTAETSSVDAVAMGCSVDVRTALMNGGVDHVRRGIEQLHRASFENFTLFANAYEIGSLDEGEGDSERIDPESVWFDRIAKGDMSRNTFI
jgi:hypothetical protein